MTDLFLVLHVLGAAIWFGGAVYVEGLMAGAARTKDPVTIMTVGGQAGQTSQRLFTITGIIVFLSGIFLVLDSGAWEFEMLFISIGFAASLLVIALGLFYFKPKSVELGEIIAEHGLTSDQAMGKAKQLANVTHFSTLMLTIAILAMVLKPGI